MANRAVPAIHQAGLAPAWQLTTFDSNWDSSITALNDSSLGYVNGVPTDTGSANNYLVTLPFGTPSSYQQGMTVTFKAVNANTGTSTLTVSPLTAVQLVNIFGNALVSGDILANDVISCTYNGTVFVVTSPISSNILGAAKFIISTGGTGRLVFGGVTIQWATGIASTGGSPNTFGTAFSSSAYVVLSQPVSATGAFVVGIQPISATGFTATSNTGTPNIYYIAIGPT